MTNEIRVSATSEIISVLESSLPADRIVKARVGKKDCYLYKTSVNDDSGRPVWVELDYTVKSNDATKTHDGFDADAAQAERVTADAEKATKAATPKKAAPKGNAEATENRLAVMRAWANANAEKDKGYTATEIWKAMSDEQAKAFATVMQVGSIAGKLVSEGFFDMSKQDGKSVYTVR